MALGRKFLEPMGLTEVQVQAIIDAHMETVNGLIARAEKAEAAAENTPAVTKERDDLKKQLEELQKANGDAAKIQKEFDDYKAGIEAEKTTASRKTTLREVLKNDVGVKRESALNLIMAAEKPDDYEWDSKNQLKDPEAVVKILKERHAEWIGEVTTEGVQSLNPLSSGIRGKGGMTRAEIVKLRDPAERQRAIAENIELFKA